VTTNGGMGGGEKWMDDSDRDKGEKSPILKKLRFNASGQGEKEGGIPWKIGTEEDDWKPPRSTN